MIFDNLLVNGVNLVAVVFGLVEFFKSVFKLQGSAVTALSAAIGMLVILTYQLQTVIPEPYSTVYQMVILALGGGLTASGFYKFSKKFVPTETSITLTATSEEIDPGSG